MRPGMNGTGARKRQARNPNRKAPRDDDPVIRRTSVPVSAAAASTSRGRTTKWRASSGAVPKTVMTAASEPQLAPVIPGLGRQAVEAGEARRRIDRLGPGPGEIRPEDRVVRLVHELEGLDAIARALHERRAVEQRHGDDEDAHRRGPPRSGSGGGPTATSASPAIALGSSRSTASTPASALGRRRRPAASPIAMAKPTATGVNELRPPDAIAAHQAASTSRPEARPTPSVSPAGASALEQPDESGDPDAEQQADGAEQQPLADRQPDRAVGHGDREARKTRAGLYRRSFDGRPRPDGQGMRSTVGPPRGRPAG